MIKRNFFLIPFLIIGNLFASLELEPWEAIKKIAINKKNAIGILLNAKQNPQKNKDYFVVNYQLNDTNQILAENLISAIKEKFKFNTDIKVFLQDDQCKTINPQDFINLLPDQKNNKCIIWAGYCNIYFTHSSFQKTNPNDQEPRPYLFSGDMIKELLSYKKTLGVVESHHALMAYDAKKRLMSFNDRTIVSLQLPKTNISLNITVKTRTNPSSDLTDIQAIYNAIRKFLNLHDTVQMQITFMKNGKYYYNYQGGKLNNEGISQEDLKSTKNFQILKITFPSVSENDNAQLINDILKNKNSDKKYDKNKIENLYNEKKFEVIEKQLRAQYGGATININVKFKNNKTTIGIIKNAVREKLHLADDISIDFIYAGKQQQNDAQEIENKNEGNIFQSCAIRLNQIFFTQEFNMYLNNSIEENPKIKITTIILQNLYNEHSKGNNQTLLRQEPTASEMDIFKKIQNITTNKIWIGEEQLVIQNTEHFKNLILNTPGYSYLLQTIINEIDNKDAFINWFLENFQDYKTILIYQYPGKISDLYNKNIIDQEIELLLQRITLEYPFYLAGKNAIAEIVNNHEHWNNLLQTDTYYVLNTYLNNKFSQLINFRYYQLYASVYSQQSEYNQDDFYQKTLYNYYHQEQQFEPSAPPLEEINKPSNIDIKIKKIQWYPDTIQLAKYGTVSIIIYLLLYKLGIAPHIKNLPLFFKKLVHI